MVYFDYGVAEQDIVKECFQYLPNPNDVQDTVYKVHFVVRHPLSSLPPEEMENPDLLKVYTAFFKIEYEETGSKTWAFDSFDSNLKTDSAEPHLNN